METKRVRKPKKEYEPIVIPPRGAYSLPKRLKQQLSMGAILEKQSPARQREIRLLMIDACRLSDATHLRKLRSNDNVSGGGDSDE